MLIAPPVASDLALVARAGAFAERAIAPYAAGWDAGGDALPRGVVDEYAALGLAGLQVSAAHGGQGAGYRTKLRVAEAIAVHCFGSAFALNNLHGSVTRMEREESSGQIALLVDRAAGLVEAGEDAQVEAALAKKHAAEMATEAVAACMQVMGAEGLRSAHPLGRHLAAARIAAYVDGTTEMMNERIGAALEARYG